MSPNPGGLSPPLQPPLEGLKAQLSTPHSPTPHLTHQPGDSHQAGIHVLWPAQWSWVHRGAYVIRKLRPSASHPSNSPATGQALPACWSPEEVCKEGKLSLPIHQLSTSPLALPTHLALPTSFQLFLSICPTKVSAQCPPSLLYLL